MVATSDTILLRPSIIPRNINSWFHFFVTPRGRRKLESRDIFARSFGVLFFRRLLTFKLGNRLKDFRRAPRHPVGEAFSLKSTVTLLGTDQIGAKRTAAAGSGCRWSGRPLNLSLDGLSMHLPPAAIAVRGEETSVVLSVEGRELEIPCVVAHFRSFPRYSLCGLSLHLTDPVNKTAYLQLLEAVGIGASFTPVKKLRGIPAPDGMIGEQYKSGKKYVLTAWRRAQDRNLVSFELLLDAFCVKGAPAVQELEVYTRQPENRNGKVAYSAPALSLSTGKHAEVRQLYRWIVHNMPKSLPADLRALLVQFVAKPEDAG